MRVRPALTAAAVLLAVALLAAVSWEVLVPGRRPALDSTAALEAAIERELETEHALRQLDAPRPAGARDRNTPAAGQAADLAADRPGAAQSARPADSRQVAPPPGSDRTPAAPSVDLETDESEPPPPAQGRGEIFYFFSPDWRPSDLGKLAVAVETAFASGGLDVSFQAFTKYDDFERQAIDNPPQFMMAPAWIGDRGNARLGSRYTVVARPVRHGRTTYRKALMTRPGIEAIDDLARRSIAATLHSMGPGDPESVLGAFRLAGDSARIVPVPKDVDALLALSFGQVDAALVTSEQYEQLSKTSPADTARMRVLAFTPEIGLPPVYASSSCDPALRDHLAGLLGRLTEVPEGPTVLALLGIDRFEPEQAPAGAPAAGAGEAAAGGLPPAGNAVAKSSPPDKMGATGAAPR